MFGRVYQDTYGSKDIKEQLNFVIYFLQGLYSTGYKYMLPPSTCAQFNHGQFFYWSFTASEER